MAGEAGLGTALRLGRRLRHPELRSSTLVTHGDCEVCGRASAFKPLQIIPDALAETAGMTPVIRAVVRAVRRRRRRFDAR